MEKSVLVTGATGYLGGRVVDQLLQRHYSVRVLVRDASRLAERHRSRITAVEGDLCDPAAVLSAAEGVRGILHLAGIAADWVPDSSVFEAVNVKGTAHVLEAARVASVARTVVTSTVMVLGPTDGLAMGDERTRPPEGPSMLAYQRTKARALDLARASVAQGLDVVITFPGALFGPGALTEGNYLARVMEKLLTHGYPALPKTHGAQWCLAHVDDVAEGHVLAFERGHRGGEYVLGGENVPFDRMLEIMKDGLLLSGLPPRIPGKLMLVGLSILEAWHAFFGSRPPISYSGGRALLHDWSFSSARAALELGYRIRAFEPSFKEFVRWYRDERGKAMSHTSTPAAHAH